MTPDENKIITKLVEEFDWVDSATVTVIAMETLSKYKAILREDGNKNAQRGEW